MKNIKVIRNLKVKPYHLLNFKGTFLLSNLSLIKCGLHMRLMTVSASEARPSCLPSDFVGTLETRASVSTHLLVSLSIRSLTRPMSRRLKTRGMGHLEWGGTQRKMFDHCGMGPESS